MYYVYWLINETKNKTYVGFTDNLERRIKEHRRKKIKSTKNFVNFQAYKIDKADTISEARKKEIYWKSKSGRKKLKKLFNTI